jgi:hypothetical protein
VNSTAKTIQNSAPSTGQPSIDQATLYTDTDATCTNGTSADADGDSVSYTWAWYVNGVIVGDSSNYLSSGNFSKGQTVICEAKPYDGANYGVAMNSTDRVVQNTAPVAGTVSIDPTTANEASTLTCTPSGFTDADTGDSLSYNFTWYNSSVAISGPTSATLTGTYFDKGDSITCQATAYDGSLYSGDSAQSDPVVIDNSAPSISLVSVTPDPAYQTTLDLTCTPSGWSDADSDSPSYFYAWYKDTLIIDGQTASALPNTTFAKTDSIVCRVTPFDGEVNGTAVDSSARVISNSIPTAPTGLSPSNGATETTLDVTMSWTTGTDADTTDTLTNYWMWYETDSSYTTQTDSDAGTGLLSKQKIGLSNDTTYYWAVLTSDGTFNSTAVQHSFTVLI